MRAILFVIPLLLLAVAASDTAELSTSDVSISSEYCIVTCTEAEDGFDVTYYDKMGLNGDLTIILIGGTNGAEATVQCDDQSLTGTFKRSSCAITFENVSVGSHHVTISSGSEYEEWMISVTPNDQSCKGAWYSKQS